MAKNKTINMVKSQVIYKDYSKDAERTALVSGENLAHMFGKIARWYTDISWVGHKHVVADITDFPALGTAASKDVPASGDAGNNEVVMGNDSRLTDARTPTSHTHSVSEITDFPTLGTAAGYDVSSSGDASNNEVVLGNDSRLTDARTPLSHTHTEADITNLGTYAGASIKGGAATSANKLNIGNSDIGNSTTPVYFDSETGLPIALEYTIEKSVPADAVFTDTTYSTMGPSGSSHAGGLVPDTPSTAGTSKYLREDGTWAVPPNSEYVHPSYTPYSSGLYKITVDTLGHVSAASAVTGADLPSHSHTVSDITNFPTLGTAAGYDVPATGDADDDEVVLGNDSRLSDARTPLSHTHTEADISDLGTYAGSSTKGGAATSANKLNIGSSDIGSETKPVYFSASSGKPVACVYSLNASVPANAVFTDINVKQSPSTANESREVLFAGNTGNTETTGTTGKSNKLYFNPSTGALTATSFSGSVDASNLTGSIDAARLPNSGVTANSYGPAAGGTLTYGGTFDVPYVTVDKYGRLTAASTKTFTMPAQYTHPSYTSKTSGLYKITVDELGHVSATSAVTASDLPSHSHTLSMATSTGSSSITLAANTKYQLTAGGSTYIFTTPTDTVYTHPTYTEKTNGLYKITVDSLGHVSATAAVTASDLPSHTHPYLPDTTKYAGSSSVGGAATSANKLNIGSSNIGNSTTPVYFDSTTGLPVALSYTIEKSVPADAKFTDTVYTHPTYTAKASGLYKITVDELGHVSAASAVTGTDLPSHSHNLSMASSTGTSQISLSANAKYQLTAGGSTYIFTTPADTNTTYTVASGDNNGQIKITPSSGDAYNVSVKGLGSAAYTNSSAYATSGHNHTLKIEASSGTSSITLLNNTKYQITAGGSTYVFTTPTGTAVTYTIETGDNNGQIKVTPSSGDAYNVSVKGLGSAAYANTSDFAPASHSHDYLPLSGGTLTGMLTIKTSAFEKVQIYRSGSSNNAAIHFYNDSQSVTKNCLGSIAMSGNPNGGLVRYSGDGSTSWKILDTSNTSITQVLASGTKIATIKINGVSTDLYCQTNTNTTYTIATGDSNGQIKVTPSSGSAYNVSVKGLGSAAYTNSSAYAAASHTHSQYLPLAGGTMTGAITLALDKYNVDEYGLDCNNSNIIGVNNIKFKDDPDEDASEGIHFYRTDSTWDSLWGRNGALYFTPNHPTGTTNYTIYHSGNLTYSTIGAAAANHTHSNYLGAKSANGFYGMASPSTDDTVWIRTTSLGLIPYQSGAAGSGHQSLGTSSWYFSAAYIDNIYGTLNGRAVYADNSYVLVTDPSSTEIYGLVFATDPSITEDNTLRKSNSIRINHFVGAANTEGITELIIGNSVAKSSAGNSSGHLTLYNSNGKWAEIYPNASATADYNLYLPASTGTLALVGDNNHTHNYAGSSSAGGAATSANKLNTNAGSNVSPVYFSGGVPVACKQAASGAYFSTVPYVRSDGVVEIGRYIDFHTTNTSTAVNYRIDQWTTESIEFNALGTNNRVNIYTPGSGYTRLSFQVGDVVTSGIIVKPLTTSGTLMQVECGGNMIIGSGESPTTLVSNSYDSIDTSETERLYLASDAEICFITSAQTYSGLKEVILDTNGNFRIGPSQVIVQTQNSTSNYTELVNWWSGGTNPGNYGPSIGQHNVGDTDGSIIILPYHTTSNPWDAGVGLFVSKTRLLYNGTAISLNGHTHSYLPLSGGTMTGHIVFNSVTSTSYPASSNYLYWSGSTDWAKIYYRVDASDAGRLVLDIGDDTNARIDFAYNGTTKSYIDTNGNFSGNAASATKLGTNAGGAITPVYFSGGKPVACNVQASSGSYFNNVAIIRSDGVMEMGRYIDFHNASDSTYDYTYRLESPSNGSFTLTSNTNNVLKLYSSTGYNQIRFHTGESGKAYNASGITVYPLTTSGSCMMIESGGNMIIGAGESPSSIYSNDYLGAKTSENEYMFVSADTGVVLVSGADTFANKSAAIFDYDGAFRPVTADTLSIGSSTSYWNKAYITQTIGGTGGTWISARDRATVKSICVPASSAFCPVATVKTNNGAWSIGSLGTSDKSTEGLYFSYTTDADYSTGTNAHASYTISTTGAFSGSAAKWTTARTLTIGSTGKSVDGSGNVSWSLSEIGAASSSHTHKYLIDPGASAYKVEVAWEGASVPTSETTYPAVYTTYNMTSGMTIRLKETTWTNVKSFLGLGASAYKSTKTLSAVSHSGWTNNATDDNIVATMSFIAFWNGAYNSSGNSNLAYCNQGKFGSIVTKSSSYYIPLSGSTGITGELASSSANAFRAYCGGYGAFFRNDGNYVYLLFTDKKTDGSEKTANWNSLRPFYCQLSSGYVTMENGLSVESGLTASDITTTGYLKLGYKNDSTLPSTGIYVNDIRSVNVPASGIGGHLVNFYFHMADSPDTSRWWSIMHVKGWEGAYCAWELAGTAHNTDDRTRPLYVRCSNANTAWGSWRKIYDTSNKPTLSELGAASSSHTHSSIIGPNKHDAAVPTSTVGAGVLTLFYNVDNSSGNMPKTNNANAILQINKHSGEYDSQLGFSSDGNIYYRSATGSAFTTSSPWKQLAWNDDKLGANSDGSYWGMAAPNNDSSVWIRTTSLGIIPYQSGNLASGHQYLGTSSWYFSQAYVDNYHGHYLGLGSGSVTGSIEIQGPCSASVAYGSSNPHIRFYNDDATQNIDIIFNDYDTVRAPAALSIHGNQGGEYLLAPNIAAWDYTNNKWYAELLTWSIGTTSTVGQGRVIAGNGTAKGTAGNARGIVEIYSEQSGCVFLQSPSSITTSYTVTLPSSAGTLELVGHTHSYLPLAGGTMTGNLTLTESKSILLRPNHSSYTSGIGYDTSGNECIGIWAKNTVTRLRWHAGVDMTTMTSGTMMGITYPDFEISKASGSAHGYIAGYNITRSYVLFSGSASITSGKEKTTLTLSDQLSNYDWCVIRFWYSGSPSGYCEAMFASAHYSAWLSAAFSTTPGGGTSYTACHTMSIYIDSPNAGTRNIYFNCDAGLTIYKVIGYMAD